MHDRCNTQQRHQLSLRPACARRSISSWISCGRAASTTRWIPSSRLSYLIFLRLLSEKDEMLAAAGQEDYKRIFSGEWARFAWGNFVTLTGDQLFDAVRDAIEKLHELPGLSDTGKLLFNRATLKIYDRPTLRAVVQVVQRSGPGRARRARPQGRHVRVSAEQACRSRAPTANSARLRHIIDMIVALVDPQPGERMCDPACGTAGFADRLLSTTFCATTPPRPSWRAGA